jgi:hypothetical protein
MSFAWRGLTLAAAVELDFFSHIASGKTGAEQIAAAAGASEHGTRRLLDALCGMGYLKKRAKRYRLSPSAAEYLVRTRPLFMGDAAVIGKMLVGPWSMLAEFVKSGGPLQAGATAEERAAFFSKLVPAIFPASFLSATAAVKRLPQAARRRINRSNLSRVRRSRSAAIATAHRTWTKARLTISMQRSRDDCAWRASYLPRPEWPASTRFGRVSLIRAPRS